MHFAEQALEFAVRTGQQPGLLAHGPGPAGAGQAEAAPAFPTPNVFGRGPLLKHLLHRLDTPGAHPLMLIFRPRAPEPQG